MRRLERYLADVVTDRICADTAVQSAKAHGLAAVSEIREREARDRPGIVRERCGPHGLQRISAVTTTSCSTAVSDPESELPGCVVNVLVAPVAAVSAIANGDTDVRHTIIAIPRRNDIVIVAPRSKMNGTTPGIALAVSSLVRIATVY